MDIHRRRGFTPLEMDCRLPVAECRLKIENRKSQTCGEQSRTIENRRGFTLIELLVVIAIVALLMGILMPALQRARKQAKGVICQSNMRQIGLGANLYAEEYEQFVPRGLAGGTGRAWFQLFMPFLAQKPVNNDYRTVDIYRCPGYPDKEQTVCYVVNGWDFRDRDDVTGVEILKPSKLGECTQRAYTIYLADNEDGPWRHIVKRADGEGNNRCDVWNPGHLPSSNSQERHHGQAYRAGSAQKGIQLPVSGLARRLDGR